MNLDAKTALVTGGAAGIGAGIAERLAAEGMNVVVADLDREAGSALAGRIGGVFVDADAGTEAGVRSTRRARRRVRAGRGMRVGPRVRAGRGVVARGWGCWFAVRGDFGGRAFRWRMRRGGGTRWM